MSMIETVEEQAAIMDAAFREWLSACESMEKFPDLESFRKKAKELRQRFLIEQEKYLELLKALRKAVKQLKVIQLNSL